uniref:Membrane-spanning 4-domains, subfamily A, member 20 n=1 Tax=Mus musculus TaxID=10090 RepID=A0A9L6KDS4_MOUSE
MSINEVSTFYIIKEDTIAMGMAGMMLLQISVMCAITELVIAILVLHWFITAHKIEEPSEEIFSGPSHSHLSSPPSTQPSMLELENVSEQSHPKDIEDENDVTN